MLQRSRELRHPITMRDTELLVPDLTPVPSSVVDMAGNVRCVTCGVRLPLGDAQIVGLGFRCQRCALAADIAGNSDRAHLTEEERVRVRRELTWISWTGIAVCVALYLFGIIAVSGALRIGVYAAAAIVKLGLILLIGLAAAVARAFRRQ